MEGVRAPKMFAERLRSPEARSARCLNCNTELVGPFCAQCGQRDIPPYPSVRELVTDAFWELSGWDGRFAATVRAMIRAPGQLTLDFLEGRRARFISPLRLYLLASLLYFLVAAAVPDVQPKNGTSVSAAGIQIGTGADKSTAAGRVADAEAKARDKELTPAEREAALKDIERAPKIIRPVLRRAMTDGEGFRRSLLETMPRVLFALVPVFAAIIGLFYRKRKYPEHLYFALHLQAFVFVALTISTVARLTRVPVVTGIVSALVVGWIVVYAVRAARRVYGGSVAMTVAKGAAIVMMNSIAGLAGMIVAIYWAAVH